MREVSVREVVDGTLSSSTHVPRGSSSSCRGPVHRRSRSRHLRDGVLVEHLVSERVIVELDIVEPVDCCERSALQVPEGLVVRVPIDARVGEREEREEAKSSAPRTNHTERRNLWRSPVQVLRAYRDALLVLSSLVLALREPQGVHPRGYLRPRELHGRNLLPQTKSKRAVFSWKRREGGMKSGRYDAR